jgi:hypothetical protein
MIKLLAVIGVLLCGPAAKADDDCGPAPYSVAAQQVGLTLDVKLPPALANDTLKPGSTAAAGLDFVRAYFGATWTTASALLGHTVRSDLGTGFGEAGQRGRAACVAESRVHTGERAVHEAETARWPAM